METSKQKLSKKSFSNEENKLYSSLRYFDTLTSASGFNAVSVVFESKLLPHSTNASVFCQHVNLFATILCSSHLLYEQVCECFPSHPGQPITFHHSVVHSSAHRVPCVFFQILVQYCLKNSSITVLHWYWYTVQPQCELVWHFVSCFPAINRWCGSCILLS